MAAPTKITYDYSFLDHTVNEPDVPQPGDQLDEAFAEVKRASDETIDRLNIIQRDDGDLANQSVGFDQLRPELAVGFKPPVPWTPNTAYVVRDTVFANNGFYTCIVAHVSGSDFNTDQASGKWSLVADFTEATTEAQAARDKAKQWAENPVDVPVEPGQFSAKHHAAKADNSATASANSAIASANSASDSLASKNAAAASATAANTSATNAATSASDAFFNAGVAASNATQAMTAANNALNSASDALASKNAAATSATNALASENSAEDAADRAEAAAVSVENPVSYQPQVLTAAEQGQARANIGAGILAGFRNKILNGCAEITQRGTSFNILAGQAAYTTDRIRIVNNTNQTLNVQCPVVIPFAGSGKHPRLRLSFATAPTTGNVFVTQRIEGADTLASRKATMSFAHAAGEVITASCYIGQNFGTSGSAGVSTATQTVLLRNDGGIGIAKLAFDLPSTEGKIFGSSDFLEWVVSLPVRTTQPLTITRMSLVEGDATSEDDPYSPRHIRQETELVERYYREVVFRTTTSATAASQYFNLNLDQRGMRANPSVSSKGAVELINAGNFAAVSSVQVTWQALAAGPVVAGGVLVLDAEL